MNRLFGSKPKTAPPTLNDAIDGLQTRIASLDVRIAKLNGELAVYQQKMAPMRDGAGKRALKQRALKILRQRKQVEAQRDQLDSQSWNMEQTTMAQESMRNNMISLNAMKTANKDLKKQYGKIDLDKIEDMQDEMAELMEMNEEIQSTMARSYAVPEDVDEAELDAELDALDAGEFDTAENEVPAYLQEDTAQAQQPKFVDEEPAAVAH